MFTLYSSTVVADPVNKKNDGFQSADVEFFFNLLNSMVKIFQITAIVVVLKYFTKLEATTLFPSYYNYHPDWTHSCFVTTQPRFSKEHICYVATWPLHSLQVIYLYKNGWFLQITLRVFDCLSNQLLKHFDRHIALRTPPKE